MAYPNYEKFDMLECFIQNDYNSEAASEEYFNRYPERRQPNISIFGRLKENLIEYGAFNKPRSKNYRIQDAEDVAINVVGMVVANPSISSRQIETESGISRRRALSVLKKHKFRPYTIRKQQQLLPTDPDRRLDFCNWYLRQIEQDQLFFKNVIWTDESYVSSAGIFNRHNQHYWSDVNPHQTVDVQNQGRFGFSVWCALYNNRILAYQLYDGNLNGQRYYNMINYHIIEEFLDNLPLNERRHVFFQQDGAPPHNTNLISELLNTNFGEKWIGNNGPVRWPPRSPDLSPLDFFLWGNIKDNLYKKTNNTVAQLRQNLIDCLDSVSNIHIYNATKSVSKRCELCVAHNGRQFENFR